MIELYILEILKQMILALPVVAAVRILWLWLHKKPTTLAHETGVVLFVLYLSSLHTLTLDFFPFGMTWPPMGRVNLELFSEIGPMLQNGWYGMVNVWGNVLMFIPMGMLIPLLWKRGWSTVLIGFGASCLIEGLQLFSYRSTDVDDVLLNTLGTLVGYGMYKLLLYIAPRMRDALRPPKQPVLEFHGN
ncbi:MAG: VanZ family protein [Eubacteriales bacterium]